MRYANTFLTLRKNKPEEPFTMQFKWLDEVVLQTAYLPDGKIWLKGMEFNKVLLEEVPPDFESFLEELLPSIEEYPYVCPLEGQKLDVSGYDLYLSEKGLTLSPAALATARNFLGFQKKAETTLPFQMDDTVKAPHVTKLSLTLQKASPLSRFSIQLHATHPVRLASFVYESDLSGYAIPVRVNLEELQVHQSNENITILFGKPILAKRITFVLAQDNAEHNIGLAHIPSERFDQPLTEKDFERVSQLLGKTKGGFS